MRKLWKAVIVVIAIALVATLLVLVLSPDRRRLDDSARAGSQYDFIRLSEGYTEYQVAGPLSGEPVVFVHGVSVPMYDWDRQFEFFADSGYRVLRYNQYGRGLSDRPRGRYDTDRYVSQLRELIDSQGWQQVHLVGHSMGCGVAAAFASAYPDAVLSTVLIAPVLHMAEGHGGIAIVRIPVIGDVAAKLILPGSLFERSEELLANAGITETARYSSAFREQMTFRGFARSTKSLFRGNVVDDLSYAYSALSGTSTLAIMGTEDESVPAAHFNTIAALVPGMAVVRLEGIGHAPNMQVPELVNETILTFIRG